MSETPEGGFSMEFIGRTLLDMQREVRDIRLEVRDVNQRLVRVEDRLERFERDTSARFRDVEAALFRADARWRETQDEMQGLRTACEQILNQLRVDQTS